MRKDALLYRWLTRVAPGTVWKRWLKPSRLHLFAKRAVPLSTYYGFDRGTPVDRYYIERFLAANREAIRGQCLEIKDAGYTRRFGGDRVSVSDVLDIDPSAPEATLHGDLRRLDGVADDRYDCIILTQVLQYVDDCQAALGECRRILKPGGTLLATVPTLSRIGLQAGVDGDFWRFTGAGASRLFSCVFDADNVEAQAHGNVLTGLAFWVGMAIEEVSPRARELEDPSFPLLVTVKAVKR